MTVIETSSTSWFSRLGGSIKQCGLGIVLFIIAVPLLFWNEGRAVKTYNSLKEGQSAVISVPSDSVDPANQGRLIHITGKAATDEVLKDTTFSIEVNAIHLIRKVQMYQWFEREKTETKKKVGGGEERKTTYSYDCEWSSELIRSGQFKESSGHLNPTTMPYQSTSWTATKVNMGAFVLPDSVISQIRSSESVAPEKPNESIKDAHVTQSGYLYFGKSEATPQVGDVRISFQAVKPQNMSVIASQLNNTLAAYQTKAGNSLLIVDDGFSSAEEMFAKELQSNKIITWVIRVVGFLLMLFGIQMFLSPLVILTDVLPFLGNILSIGTFIVSFCISLASWCIIVAIAWLFYRPVLSISLLVVTAAAIFFIRSKSKKQSTVKQETKPEVEAKPETASEKSKEE